MQYRIIVTVGHGWGETIIEAESEEAAREKFDKHEWEWSGDVRFTDVWIELIEEVKEE